VPEVCDQCGTKAAPAGVAPFERNHLPHTNLLSLLDKFFDRGYVYREPFSPRSLKPHTAFEMRHARHNQCSMHDVLRLAVLRAAERRGSCQISRHVHHARISGVSLARKTDVF